MSTVMLHMKQDVGETSVSNVFLDEYMPRANGEYVKIYLYLLRCLKSGVSSLSIPSIADHFEHTEKDVRRALAYWEKQQLLLLKYDQENALTDISLQDPASCHSGKTAGSLEAAVSAAPEAAAGPEISGPAVPQKPPYTPDQLDRFQDNEEAREILFVCEQYLGRPLRFSEISTIYYFYDGLRFSAELIEYLIEYCVSGGHRSMKYIESVAIAWFERGYRTAAEAKKDCAAYGKSYFTVLKAFGLGRRNPGKSEVEYVDKWLKEWEFPLELIKEACDRTIAAIHQPSFEYADSILSSWHSHQVKTLKDVQALDRQRPSRAGRLPAGSAAVKRASSSNAFHNFSSRDYDYAELEKKLINT